MEDDYEGTAAATAAAEEEPRAPARPPEKFDGRPDSVKLSPEPGDAAPATCTKKSLYVKRMVYLLLSFLLVQSNLWVRRVIAPISPSAVENHAPTRGGTFLQGLSLVLLCIFTDYLTKQEIL